MVPRIPLRRVARGAAAVAGLTGAYGVLTLMGAFGPVGCWTGQSSRESSDGEVVTEVTRDCEAGIDYLFGATGGNAPVLFFWAVVLAAVVGVGAAAAWTGRRRVAWGSAVVGVAVSIIGIWSIGWSFALPTLFLLVAAAALTADARRAQSSPRDRRAS